MSEKKDKVEVREWLGEAAVEALDKLVEAGKFDWANYKEIDVQYMRGKPREIIVFNKTLLVETLPGQWHSP